MMTTIKDQLNFRMPNTLIIPSSTSLNIRFSILEIC